MPDNSSLAAYLAVITGSVALAGAIVGLIIQIKKLLKAGAHAPQPVPQVKRGPNGQGAVWDTLFSKAVPWFIGAVTSAVVGTCCGGFLFIRGCQDESVDGKKGIAETTIKEPLRQAAVTPAPGPSSTGKSGTSQPQRPILAAGDSPRSSTPLKGIKPQRPPFFGRMWTDTKGKKLGEAELVKVENGQVHLKKRDGTVFDHPVEQLSSDDLRYISTGVLLTESFSGYKEGDVTKWGRDAWAKKLLDGRKWLVTSNEGQHTIGVDVALPQNFYVEFDYCVSVYSQRGFGLEFLGPVPSSAYSKMSLIDEEGVGYAIRWTAKGTDANANGAVDHTFELADRAKETIRVDKAIGLVRVLKKDDVIKVIINGQVGVSGHIDDSKQYRRFEVDVYKGPPSGAGGYQGGANSFTSFKMGKIGLDQSANANPQSGQRPDGILILKTKAAAIPGVEAWVEIDGKREADWNWKVGTSEVRVKIPAGNHRVVVYSIYKKVRRTVFEQQIEVAPDTTLPVDVEP